MGVSESARKWECERERERLRGCENMGATEEEGRGREKNKKGTYV